MQGVGSVCSAPTGEFSFRAPATARCGKGTAPEKPERTAGVEAPRSHTAQKREKSNRNLLEHVQKGAEVCER